MDHRQLICPHPTPMILLQGCTTNECSLLRAVPAGFLTGSTTPQIIGLVVPCAKTNRPRGCTHRLHWGGGFLPKVVLTRRPPTGNGNRLLTNCGRMNAIANRQRPANAISTRKPLVNHRRSLAVNNFLTSMPANAFSTSVLPTNARRPPIVKSFSTRRLLGANVFWIPVMADRGRNNHLSFGFAATASKSTLPGQLRSGSNVRPLSPACDTSRNAAGARQ